MLIYPLKNSYLQSVCAVNPSVVNKAVDQAMHRVSIDSQASPQGTAELLESMQPSLYCPHVDITRSSLGFGRVGLRILNRDLHSPDPVVQLQALHSIMDQVQISENALVLIHLNVVYRLFGLMRDPNPIVREKVCLTYTHLAAYYQGRNQIMAQPLIIENLLRLIMRDSKEIRYAAACTLRTLATDRETCKTIMKNNNIIDNLLKMIKDDFAETVIQHLKTLENLIECDAKRALQCNCFTIMRRLFHSEDAGIVSAAMNVMIQLCKHEIGRKLADIHDLTRKLRNYLYNRPTEVIISAVGILTYTTLTGRGLWRAKELCNELTKRLVKLCHTHNKPQLQLRCMQVLINLCESPDIRQYLNENWLTKIRLIRLRTPEKWDGSSGTADCGLKTGHYYRTVYIEGEETIRYDFGDHMDTVNVPNYLIRLREIKHQLIRLIKSQGVKNKTAVTFE